MRKLDAFLVLACAAPVALSQGYSVSGTVRGVDGSPLPGALVSVDGTGIEGYADCKGCFELSGLPGGSSLLSASMCGMESSRRDVRLPGDTGPASIDFTLRPSGAASCMPVSRDLPAYPVPALVAMCTGVVETREGIHFRGGEPGTSSSCSTACPSCLRSR